MFMTISADWVMVMLACATGVGTVVGYLIKQNSRITNCETQIKTLSKVVEKNVETINDLAINMSAINEKLSLLLDMRPKG